MSQWLRVIAITISLTAPVHLSLGDEHATLTGKVVDAAGKPIEHATVLIYHGGVKKGYSTFCPSCYADCGKRTLTDAGGMFSIKGLNPDLWFELLVVRDGYQPGFVRKVDPSLGSPITAVLAPREKINDPKRVVRGRVVDTMGQPVRDAVVEPVGILFNNEGGHHVALYGTIAGLEPIAVTNENGEFEIAYAKPALKILLSVEARGMAPKKFNNLSTGLDRQAMTVTTGATVRGRLVQDGKPVGDAEVGLIGRERGGYGQDLVIYGDPYDEIKVGTRPDGSFVISNVPSGVAWYLYGKMESIATRGATGVIECATKHDGEIVNVGDIQVKPAYRLRGRVVLSDGKPIPDGMRVTISSERAWDTQTAMLPPEGRFEFVGLARDSYSVFASVKGYTLPKAPVSVKGEDGSVTTYPFGVAPPFLIDRDVDNFVITLQTENEANSTGK